ncbi:beta strand repeat-containing protein [Aliarcobacter cryaerophilus]|uniref:beta strand repeat-containing protein n=1 Tax=Aliarcobacter cryaerophilus TaxID=28198 RepID=UPI003DA66813
MAKLTKNKKYAVEMYIRYFGKTPTNAQIDEYAEFGKAKLILNEIRTDAGLKNANMSEDEQIHDLFNNLFGRPAIDSELTKYKVKYLDKGKALPINSIIKAAKKGSSDKAVWDTKNAVALFIAEEGSKTNIDLDKITKDTYKDVYDLKAKKLLVDSVTELKTKIDAMKDNVTGQTYTLTTSVDQGAAFTGTEKSDVFYANYDNVASLHTLGALDELDGGAGKDTLNITSDDTSGGYTMAAATIKNIETITIKGVEDVTADVSGSNITGLETISVLKSKKATVTAATTTNVNVSGASDDITVKGGKDITITDNTAASSIKVDSDTTGNYATGKITITDTNFGVSEKIDVDGGTDVTITATADKVAVGGAITVGASKAATGDVKVVSNTTSDGTAVQAGNVTVTGGKTVEITANMTNTAVKGGGTGAITAGKYTVTAGDTTTNVTITQNAKAIDFENNAAAATAEVSTVTFGSLKAGEKAIISAGALTGAGTDLTFTASKDLTAAEVAAAFANLADSATQSATGITANGYFTGKLDAGWTSGAVSGSSVTFTATTVGDQTNEITVSAKQANGTTNTTNVADFKIASKTDGTTPGSTAVILTEKFGDVVVDDNATKSITTITLDGFDNAALGAGGSLDKLATLNLTNGQGSAAGTVLTSTVATLTVNVDDMAGTVDLDGSAATTLKTLTLNANGEASSFALDANAVETLTIAAAANLDISAAGTKLSALKTVTITGAKNVDLGDLSGSTSFATLNASAAKGGITAEVDGTKATVTTGSGKDVITVSTATITQAINLGDGDDILDLSALNDLTGLATISGGAGSDTVVLKATNANDATGLSLLATSAIFKSKVTEFEKLEIANDLGSSAKVNVGNLGYNYVITNAIATNVLTLDNMANNGTVELNAAKTGSTDNVEVLVKDAATGKADVLNVVLNVNAGENHGTLTAASVETIKITATDSTPVNTITGADSIDTSVFALAATSAKTVTITGNAHLNLDMTTATNTAVTLIDASTMKGNLTVTASNAGMTVKGGDGNDTLSVVGAKSGVILTGGKGTDTFDVSKFDSSGNAGSAVTITDLTAGETIKFAAAGTGAEKFVSSKITLIAEATFTEYVAEASKVASADGAKSIAWFQFNNNTFVVQDINGTSGLDAGDIIVKINGVKDLSTASFNADDGTLVIA